MTMGEKQNSKLFPTPNSELFNSELRSRSDSVDSASRRVGVTPNFLTDGLQVEGVNQTASLVAVSGMVGDRNIHPTAHRIRISANII